MTHAAHEAKITQLAKSNTELTKKSASLEEGSKALSLAKTRLNGRLSAALKDKV